MTSSEGLTDLDFKQLLTVFSEWYDDRGYLSMLKVLYWDLVKNKGELRTASGTMKLMDLLITSGKLHSTDLKILYDTIKATDTYGLENEIKPKIPSCPNIKDEIITRFTPHRQKVMELGLALIDKDVKKISGIYNKKLTEYADAWSLIIDLENRTIISKGKMKEFIKNLRDLKLLHAVKAVSEGTSIAVTLLSQLREDPKYALNLLKDLEDNKTCLAVEDRDEFLKRFKKLINYFRQQYLDLIEVSDGSVVLCLSAPDPKALQNLWKLHFSKKLIRDLAKILVPQKHQQDFLDEWKTYIDPDDYKNALTLSKLKEKGIGSKRRRHSSDSEGRASQGASTSGSVQGRASKRVSKSRSVQGRASKRVSTSGSVQGRASKRVSTSGSVQGQASKRVSRSRSVQGRASKRVSTSGSVQDIPNVPSNSGEGYSEGISVDNFNTLLMNISIWYDKHGYISMLKVLYRDHVANTTHLENASGTLKLFDALIATGSLSSTDISILFDTIKVTKTLDLESEIKLQLPLYTNVGDGIIKKFTPHRQKVIGFGMALNNEDVGKISGLYNTPKKKYADTWYLIMDLEHRLILVNETKSMKVFIDKLTTIGLVHTKALTQGIGVRNIDKRRRRPKGRRKRRPKEENDLATESTSKKFKGELPEDGYVGVASGLDDGKISEGLSKDGHKERKTQLVQTERGVTDDAFQRLLLVISNWYDKYGYISMLKVLYWDHLKEISILSHASRTLDLLQLLIACGYLDSTNISLIFDTIKATKTFGLENEIKPQLPLCPDVRDVIISKFTPHRQKVIKLGMALTNDDVVVINELYNVPIKEYVDSWSLIMDLEHRMIICEEKMDAFIDNLKKSELLQALKALKEVSEEEDLATEPTAKMFKGELPEDVNVKHDVGPSTGGLTDDDKFQQLLLEVSNWYDNHGCISMLKILYWDHLKKIPLLSYASKTLDLLHLLIACGDMDSTNISLISDTLMVTLNIETQLPGVIISNFTSHRKKIIKLGMALTKDDTAVINELYNVPVKEYADSWSLIMDLEHRMIICEGKMEAFIDNLKKSELLQAVKALSEGKKDLTESSYATVKEISKTLSKDHEEQHDIGSGHEEKDLETESSSVIPTTLSKNDEEEHDIGSGYEEKDLEIESSSATVKEIPTTSSKDYEDDHNFGSGHEEKDIETESVSVAVKEISKPSLKDHDEEQGIGSDHRKDSETESASASVKEISKPLSKDHNEESSHGLTDMDFKMLLTVFSHWYDQHGYLSMLKVLYRDLVADEGKLSKATNTMELLNLLITSGDLNLTDLKIIYDTVKATGTFGLEDKIKPKIPSCPNIRDVTITKFTTHRQKVVKLGLVLIDKDIVKISGMYNKKLKEYADSWSLITDLENRMIICESEMEEFIETLRELELHNGVQALMEAKSISLKLSRRRNMENDNGSDKDTPERDRLHNLIKLISKESINLNPRDIPEFYHMFEKFRTFFEKQGFKLLKISRR